MDRTSAIDYLTGEYSEVVTEVKLTSDQTTTAYTNAIDMSLRQLGVADIDLSATIVSQSQTISFIALLNYYVLKRLVRVLALKYDVNVTGAIEAKRSQAYEQIKQLFLEAEQEAINLGFNVGGIVGFQLGSIQLDFLEPSLPAEYYTNEGTLF